MSDADVRYAKSGDLHIAYDVTGDGPVDIVHVPGILTTLEAQLSYPPLARFHDQLTHFARVIRFDKRGTGLSDRLAPGVVPPLEERIDDIRAVMDAVDSDSAVLVGVADGGQVAMVFAATYPQRVRGLVLNATAPRVRWAEDWPWGRTDEQMQIRAARIEHEWGSGMLAAFFGIEDGEGRRAVARLERLAGTPTVASESLAVATDTDIRDVLPTISAPTLVVHDTGHQLWPVEGARYAAEHIPNARLVEVPGQPATFLLNSDRNPFADLIEEFVTGTRPAPPTNRVLKTVMFTDIVGSTQRAAELGDTRWRQLLDDHDAMVQRVIAEGGGVHVNTTGDGAFAVFDGPARAIGTAQRLIEAAKPLGLELRVGIHTGECEQRGDDYAGIAVHIGARVSAQADANVILVTGTVRDLVAGSGIQFEDLGRRELKGVPGDWQLLAIRA
jgi:class 3 adenylate cyclase